MSVTDRWHKSYPRPGDEACRCGTKRRPLYPTAEHEQGDRWQVRWKDLNGKQCSRNFTLKEGKNPDAHADAYDKQVQGELLAGTYTDPKAARETFGKFAVEVWLKNQAHDPDTTGAHVEGLLRNHVLEDAAHPGNGRTVTGAASLGQHPWDKLQRYPTITRAWIVGIPLAPSSATQVIRIVSSIFITARGDRLINVNPTQLESVKTARPKWVPKKTRPWTPAAVDRAAAGLALACERYEILPYLGAATGMRPGEMFGFSVDDMGEPEFFRRQPVIQVRRQVTLVKGVRCFRPVKNEVEHAVPVPVEFAEMLLTYMDRYPPSLVTLPWMRPGGKPVTHRLVITRPDGYGIHYGIFMDDAWKPALAHAGIIPPKKETDGKWAVSREDGPHRLRHTAVSQWLDGGASITDVAEWIGDSVQTVWSTYAHMMPGADDKARAATSRFFSRLTPSARIVPSRGSATG